MSNKLSSVVDSIITFLLLAVAGLTPLIFFNQTTEFFEMPKLAFLVFVTVVLIGLWIFSWILKGKVYITRTPLDIPLLVLLVAVVVSTYFSGTRIEAIYGNFPRVHGSSVAWITYILLYFVAVSNLKTFSQIKALLYVLYGSGVVISIISIMAFFGIFSPYDFAQAYNFTPTGSSFSTISLLLLLLPLSLYSILNKTRYLPSTAAVVLATIFGITIALIGSIPSYTLLVIVFTLCFVLSKKQQLVKALPMYLIPTLLVALVLLLSYTAIPGFGQVQKLQLNFPREVQLPLLTSWKISISAFRDAPLMGTGPSSYAFDFTSYKPIEFNTYSFWNFPFDSAYSEFLQVLATLGVLGAGALIVASVIIVLNSWKNFPSNIQSVDHGEYQEVLAPLAVSGLLVVLLLFIHATTLVSIVASFLVLALLMACQKSIRENVMDFSVGLRAASTDKQIDLFPVIVFIVFLIGGAFVLFKASTVIAADYYHRQALLQANKSGTLTYQYLQKAESLNPYVDLYRVDMAQTNFALANQLVAKKGPSKANPKGSLTDQDKTTIQTLISQAINEGRASVVLSPRSARNVEVLGSIYRNITGVAQNALAYSLNAYGQAIQLDPINPALRLSIGGIYYSVKNYAMAARFFTDAINLKPDYVNAYYNLAIALRDGNDLTNALSVAQQTVALLQKQNATNTPAYKTATALVADLKAKVATASKNQTTSSASNIKAPAAETGSALQNSNISNVNVNSLNNPPAANPPAAVKSNPNAKVPQITPALSPTGVK